MKPDRPTQGEGDERRRLGVFGGTFDPIHNGHIAIAVAALEQHRLEQVVFVPARHQPHKAAPPVASPEHRLEMVRLAIAGNPSLAVSDCELRRGGRSFTIDTIQALRRELGPGTRLYLIVGADSVRELPRWKRFEELMELCAVVVAARPGWPLECIDALAALLPPGRMAEMKAMAVRTTDSPVSSTEVRRLAGNGLSIAGLVPKPVETYIRENRLYRAH